MKKKVIAIKKNPLPKKLDKAWVAYVIDTTSGSELMMISMRFPERAEKLQQIIVTAINDMYARTRNSFKECPEQLTQAARILCRDLTAIFIEKNLTMALIDGMPAPKQILRPTVPFDPKIVH